MGKGSLRKSTYITCFRMDNGSECFKVIPKIWQPNETNHQRSEMHMIVLIYLYALKKDSGVNIKCCLTFYRNTL